MIPINFTNDNADSCLRLLLRLRIKIKIHNKDNNWNVIISTIILEMTADWDLHLLGKECIERSLQNRVLCVPARKRGVHANLLAHQCGLRASMPKACQLLIVTI